MQVGFNSSIQSQSLIYCNVIITCKSVFRMTASSLRSRQVEALKAMLQLQAGANAEPTWKVKFLHQAAQMVVVEGAQ